MSDLEQEGIVISVEGDLARVRTSRHNDCENCGACPGNSAMVLDARNPLGAKPGQRVMIEVQAVGMLKSAFVVYILPLLAIVAGAVAGSWVAEKYASEPIWFQAAGAALAFAGSIGYIKFFDKSARSSANMQPVITRIVT